MQVSMVLVMYNSNSNIKHSCTCPILSNGGYKIILFKDTKDIIGNQWI